MVYFALYNTKTCFGSETLLNLLEIIVFVEPCTNKHLEGMDFNSEQKSAKVMMKPRKKEKKSKKIHEKEITQTKTSDKKKVSTDEIDKKMEETTKAPNSSDHVNKPGPQAVSAKRRPNIALLKQQAELKRKQHEEIMRQKEALRQKELAEEAQRKQKIQESKKIEPNKENTNMQKKQKPIMDKKTIEERLKNIKIDNLRLRTMHKSQVSQQANDQKKISAEPKKEFFYKAPIVCILGHVDTGKTKILDKLRESNVQGGEAGGITQQIGATFFPYSELVKKTNVSYNYNNDVPGLLVIDTPGHETFANLRSRGSSMCDFAVLVVDILHALEKQTLESIELLKLRKTPFLIALNKIDRIYQWKSDSNGFCHFNLQKQATATQNEFNEKLNFVILKFAEMGLNARPFYENPNDRKYLNIVPTSAITGEGLSDLVSKILDLSQKYMKKRITFKDSMEATVLEVKNVEGIGVTLDAIISNGTLDEGDRIVLCGADGPIATNVRSLLVPEPLKELRVKSIYKSLKHIKASLGIKIAACDLDKAIAGSRILKVKDYASEEEAKRIVMDDIKQLVDFDTIGVHLQASSLGSLEALISLARSEGIPIASIGVGKNLCRKDILKMKAIREKNVCLGAMLCFDTKVDKDMIEFADMQHVKVFEAQIIYNLIDKYKEYSADLISLNKKKNIADLVYPCMLRIIPEYIFTKRSPLILGVEILEGKLKINTLLFVKHDDEIKQIGKVTSMIFEKKNVEVAKKGEKVSIKIETTDTPKLMGRDIKVTDRIYPVITCKSIDVLTKFYKDEMADEDWKLVEDIKRTLGIFTD